MTPLFCYFLLLDSLFSQVQNCSICGLLLMKRRSDEFRCLSVFTGTWIKEEGIRVLSGFHCCVGLECWSSCWNWTHLELLLNYFHVVSLQEAQLVQAVPVQLRKQIREEHS